MERITKAFATNFMLDIGNWYNEGYCCHQKFEEIFEYESRKEIGYNSGVYGWNFTLYLYQLKDGELWAVCDGYRNTPNLARIGKDMK